MIFKYNKMEKYLVRIEFRYSDAPETEDGYHSKNKMVTIGVYDTFEEACKNGNNLLEVLESKFELHQYPDGSKASKERFSKNGGLFGGKNTLVTNLAYLKTPFEFYVQIETLKYDPIDEVIKEVVSASKRYRNYILGDVDDQNEKLCHCGERETKKYSPCCSSSCWIRAFEN